MSAKRARARLPIGIPRESPPGQGEEEELDEENFRKNIDL
jgi:hypothetical protein